MDDEFALCWNNFQDNIASGFQNLFDRGDLIDVTIACDGKLLHAHKIVLAICSPYFQEMFITNPCKHPIIILKDISYTVMCELLQFMYQGVVNVKHAELSSFMKIAQTLQIKGLTTSSQKHPGHHSYHHSQNNDGNNNNDDNNGSSGNGNENNNKNEESGNNSNNNNASSNDNNSEITEASNSDANIEGKASSLSSFTNPKNSATPASGETSSVTSLKRSAIDFFNNTIEGLSIFPRKQFKRFSLDHSSNADHHDINSDSVDNMNTSDDVFLPPIPQISMVESRLDITQVKKENSISSEFSVRNALPAPFNFEYGMYAAAAAANKSAAMAASSSVEYPNELHMSGDFPKGIASHMMDIPSVSPGERWFHGKLEFMLSQRGKPLLVYDGHTFGIQYVRKDKKYWQCNLSRKFNCKARVTTTENGEIIVTNNEHCHTEIRQHLRKDYHRNKLANTTAKINSSIDKNISNVSNNNNNNSNNNNNENNKNHIKNFKWLKLEKKERNTFL